MYEDISHTVVREDLTCCRSSFDSFGDNDTDNSDKGDSDKDERIGDIDIEKSVSIINDHDSSFSDNDEDLVQLIDDMSHESSDKLRFAKVRDEVVCSALSEFIHTPSENLATGFDILIKKNPTSFKEWFDHQHTCIKDMAGSLFKGVETVVTSKQINAFYTKFNMYLSGEEFNSSVTNLLSLYRGMGNQSIGRQFLTCIMLNIQKSQLRDMSTNVTCQPSHSLRTLPEEISPAGRGQIRYIGGYVIAKIKYNDSKSLRNKLFGEKQVQEIRNLRTEIQLLQSVCISEAEISSITTDIESLEETNRKQNIKESLVNITGNMYDFFTLLDKKCVTFLNYDNLIVYKDNLFQALSNHILSNNEILESWIHVFRNVDIDYESSMSDSSSTYDIVYDICQEIFYRFEAILKLMSNVCDLFMRVCISQSRKDYLSHLKKEKGVALRKKVMQKSSRSVRKLDMKFILDDFSDMSASHYRLKSKLLTHGNMLKDFTKVQLKTLGKAYGITILSKLKKEDMARELASAINEADCMPFPDELNCSTSIQPSELLSEPIPSSSGLSEMAQINPALSKEPKISHTAESGQYSSMLIDAQPSAMIYDSQHPPMNVSDETASSTVTRGTKRGKGKSTGNKGKGPAKRKGKVTKHKPSHKIYKNIKNSCSIL